MKYEADVNYAANPYGLPPGRSRRRGLIGLGFAVVGVAGFAGIVLYAYGKGERVAQDGGPPIIEADATPTKLRPEQPGGMDVPHQDKLVYERLIHGGKEGRAPVEHLLPPPEQPLPRPVVTPQVPAMPAAPPPPAVAPLPSGSTTTVPRGVPDDVLPPVVTPPPVQIQAGLPPPLPSGGQSSQVASLPMVPPKPAAQPPQAQPAVSSPPKTPPAAAPQAQQTLAAPPKAAPAPQSQPSTLAPPSKAAPAPAASGGFRIQLASVRTEAEALGEWKRLAGRYPEALGGLSMQLVKADLGEKGVFHRVQAGGMDEARAKAVCAQLKAQNVGCVVVRP